MSYKELDIRQSETRILQDQIDSTATTTMDSVVASINNELTPPGRLIATVTPNLVVNVGSGTIVNPNTGKNRVLPFINNTSTNFAGGTITFPSTSGTITVSPGTNASITIGASQFVAVLVQLNSSGNLTIAVSVPAASVSAVVIPTGIPSDLSLGYIIVQSNGSSVIQSITNAMLYQFVGGGGAGAGGSGTGKNYLSSYTASTSGGVPNIGNGNFELGSTTGWSLAHSVLSSFSPISTATPGTGFDSTHGGTATSGNLSFTTVSSGQISGSYSGDLVSSTTSTAGDMLVSAPFFIDIADQNSVMSITFDYLVHSGAANLNFSGTNANSFAVWIYDVTNGAWIQPVGVYNLIQNSGVGYVTASFQTTNNSTEYQLALININASTGAYSLYVDDFFTGPSSSGFIGAGSGTVALTVSGNPASTVKDAPLIYPTVGYDTNGAYNATTGLYTAPVTGFYQVSAFIACSATNPELSAYINGSRIIGLGSSPTSVSIPAGSALVYVTAGQKIAVGISTTGGSGSITDDGNNGLTIALIAGGSGAGSSNGGAIAAKASLNINNSVVANTNVDYEVVNFDTNAGFSSGVYTVPAAGFYQVNLSWLGTTNVSGTVFLTKNGVQTTALGNQNISASSGATIISCIAGDTLSIQCNTNQTLDSSDNSAWNQFSISRVGGGATTISSSSAVAFRVGASSAVSISAGNPVLFNGAPDISTTNSYNAATGYFTAPISGSYQVKAQLFIGAFSLTFQIWKNGVSYTASPSLTGSVVSISDLIPLNAGDTISIVPQETGSLAIAGTSYSDSNNFSVFRVGS